MKQEAAEMVVEVTGKGVNASAHTPQPSEWRLVKRHSPSQLLDKPR
jgi:hypothetical protein